MEKLIFKIIGIQILGGTEPYVRKSLNFGWYPFITCKNDIKTNTDEIPEIDTTSIPNDYFRIDNHLPHISISAIVGKNGSGKSTLLEILYKVINNVSMYILDLPNPQNDTLYLALGMDIRLFFQIGNDIGEIWCFDKNTSLVVHHPDKSQTDYNIESGLYTDYTNIDVLRNFFYTIVVNYSLYAFNPLDTTSSIRKEESIQNNSTWIEKMFHRNDGYLTPLVLTPFRHNGVIDINNETRLALQRLSVLSLLFHSQEKQLLPGYEPIELIYQYNENYKETAIKNLNEKLKSEYHSHVDTLLTLFEKQWKRILTNESRKKEKRPDFSDPLTQMAIFYLSYKTVKICSLYPSYSISEIHSQLTLTDEKKETTTSAESIEQKLTQEAEKIINKLIHEKSHITTKVHQCLYFIEHDNYKDKSGVLPIDKLINHQYESYDDVLNLLPPPFYSIDIRFKKATTTDITYSISDQQLLSFQTMSSGERQLLYSLSYVLYHIKNLSSIIPDANRVKYKHLNLIFDEAELYYHPEYQRIFIKRLLESLACFDLSKDIDSINIIIVTHSPFILSDIPTGNILFLGNGSKKPQTFGANIYDLLKGSFFMDYAIGGIAKYKIDEIIGIYKERNCDKRRKDFLKKKRSLQFTVDTIADDYLHKVIHRMYDEMDAEYCNTNKTKLLASIKQKEEELKQLKKKLYHEKN